MLQNFLARFGKNKERFDEMESEVKLQKMLESKQKSSNERELDRFEAEVREKQIKQRLNQFREIKKAENRVNVFANNDNSLVGHKNILTDDTPKEKSMFMGKGNMMSGGM